MVYNITKTEKETIIIFNEADNTADISTFNSALIRKLTALCKSRPNEATGKGPDQNGEFAFNIPKKWVRVNASLILTDDRRKELSERAKLKFHSF